MIEQVKEVLGKVRPTLQADGGDVELVNVNEESGVVQVKLKGTCNGCPMAMLTLKHGIERTLKQHIPEVSKVESV